ncbi:alpha-1-antitrypsin homolog [Ranitomeya imitator]|uniref:alpha-1-antitrypsin homolog n=1 Tax=Ranitomeya imitator TaxID=111125 RepID=UPI0037E8D8CB
MRVFQFFGAALLFPLLFASDDNNSHGKTAKLHRVDQDVSSVLVSYIYSRAKLKTPFDNISSEEDFHMNEKTTVKVPFMRRTGMYKVTFTDLATVVSIPCKADVEVLLIWPAEGKLSEIEENINEEKIQEWKKSMDMHYVDLLLPKLDVSSSINVQEKLTITPLADLNSGISDLSGINGEGNAKISRTVRKAIFGLDKKITDSDVSQIIEIIVDPPPIAVILPSFI